MRDMPTHLRAQTDQALEAAREALPDIGVVRNNAVARLFGDIVDFVNDTGSDHVAARVRLLAVMELAVQTREYQWPDSSSRGSQP